MTGKDLQKKRESLHLDIKNISDLLKINSDYLRAIESDSFDKLPVAVYTKGYIRCYADHLGVDPEPVIQHYSEYLSRNEKSSAVPKDTKRSTRRLSSYVISLIAVGSILLLGFILFPRKESAIIQVDQTEHRDAETQNGPDAAPVAVETGVDSADQKMSGTADDVAATGTTEITHVVQQTGAEKKERNLHIRAHEVTWIHIQLDKEMSDEVLLQPGESKTWTIDGQAFVKIGNAGGVEVHFDGNDLGVPGEKGQVITLTLPRSE